VSKSFASIDPRLPEMQWQFQLQHLTALLLLLLLP